MARLACALIVLCSSVPLALIGAQDTPAAARDTAETLEPVSTDRARQDEQTRALLQGVFDRVPALSGITVAVEAGVVHLRGTIPEREWSDRAVELARAQSGVTFVNDELREPDSLGARLRPTLERIRGYADGFVAALPLVILALLLLLAFFALASVIGRWQGPRVLTEHNPFLQGLVRRVLQGAAVLAGLLLALDLLDATALVGAVVGTAGLAGLAIGFAFKDIAENYLAGVILSFRRPFDKNDQVLVAGHEGKVVRLTARETILMTLDGNHIQVPNAIVFRETMVNFSRNPRRRFSFAVDVDPGTDLPAALDIGVETLRSMKGVMDEPAPAGVVHELAESTVTLRYFGWVDRREADFLRVRGEALRLVKTALDDAGVSMPSPEYRVALRGEAPPGPAPGRDARGPAPAPGLVEAEQRDVSVDTTIDEQIEEDRELADEPDLLTSQTDP